MVVQENNMREGSYLERYYQTRNYAFLSKT